MIASTPNPFRAEEVSCALELLAAVLDPPSGNTYEGRLLTGEDDRHVAYTCFGHTPMTEAAYDIYWLVTRAASRGKGFGQALMAAVERELRDRGARILRVETSSLEGQGGARRFYERLGYQQAGLIAGFYRRNDDLITLVKRLDT